jgi:pimeloyl-ACP methyl ester carboxylesterase
MAAPIEQRFIEVDGIRIFVRERHGEGHPTIWIHGNPNESGQWLPFLEAKPGPAIALDLPGFGRSARPAPGAFDHSVGAYGRLLAAAFAELAPGGYRLVVHDWGVVGLLAAQERPEQVRRLVVIDAVPLTAAYRWHWVARVWRRRGLGEALNRRPSRLLTGQLLRLARPDRKPMPPQFLDEVFDHWDAGTSRAILALYRSADPEVLEAAGERLGSITCPALVVWGEGDPYISPADGRFFERALPGARFREVERAGHWPWIDRPDLIAEIAAFLAADGK